MVDQIAAALAAEGEEVYVYSSGQRNKTMRIAHAKGSYILLERKRRHIFLHTNLTGIILAVTLSFQGLLSSKSLSYALLWLKYMLSIGHDMRIIRQLQPDVVSIQGLVDATTPFILATLRRRKPLTLTLHILAEEHTHAEKECIPVLLEERIPITVVSSGMRRRIVKEFKVESDDHIYVIPNAVNDEAAPAPDALAADLWSKPHRFVSAGTLNARKNQAQTLRAFALLPAGVRADSQLCLIGEDTLKGELQRSAAELGIADSVIFTGNIPHSEVMRWMQSATCMVMASKREGLSLTMLESYQCGIPIVCFDHLEAFEDLYNERCMVPVREASDQALADALLTAVNRSWDKAFIRQYAGRFNNSAMAKAYLKLFYRISLVSPPYGSSR
ncbi:MAG: glycosyltransferase family 4 protein [Prevotellaceae bacterium]|nr:glycosyltransferase family 4 protein [Prevotellaceae bacterium]